MCALHEILNASSYPTSHGGTQLAFIKRWIAEEEIIAASRRGLLTPIRLEHSVESTLHFVDFIKDGKDSLLHHLVRFFRTQVEGLQVSRYRL